MITNEILRLAGLAELPTKIISETPHPNSNPDIISIVKHVFIAAIKYYTTELNSASTINLKHEYKSIIDKLDNILGDIKTGQYKNVVRQWNMLDNQIKQYITYEIVPKDSANVFIAYFTDEPIEENIILSEYTKDPHDRAVDKDIHAIELAVKKLSHHQAADMGEKEGHDKNDIAVAKLILKLEKLISDLKKAQHKDEVEEDRTPDEIEKLEKDKSDYEIEKEEKDENILYKSMHEDANPPKIDVEYMADYFDNNADDIDKEEDKKEDDTFKVPANIVKDIKDKIKEIEEEMKYTAHLATSVDQSSYDTQTINVLNSLLNYFEIGDDHSLKMAATLIQSEDSAVRIRIPSSVWKMLSLDLYPMTGTSLKDRFKVVKLAPSKQ